MNQDWDLLAVVRGGHTNNNVEPPMSEDFYNNNYNNMVIGTSKSGFVPNLSILEKHNNNNDDHDHDLLHTYPHLFESTTAFDELEELYKPFYTPVLHSSLISSPTSCVSFPQQVEIENIPQKIMVKNVKQPATKYKKRKNQQKRVVKEVKEDGLCADMWAWRKYGQKPIKGSPYPRSYYRCSSSKGCSARKQVERSPSNPEIFIITYTAEHSHAHPTRRNSLAGSTRSKFPAAVATASKTCSRQLDDHKSSTTPDHDLDVVSTKDVDVDQIRDDDQEMVQKEGIKREYREELDGESTSEIIGMPNDAHHHDLIMSGSGGGYDQMFPSLDELERGLEELDAQTSKKELFFDHHGGFFDGNFGDDHFFDHANWFVDHFSSSTISGAC
ncbi:hypothetical protein TIFTF001_003449 [Ficus carica]|uniref:WRKY domain-containing protein n=1 Tax=Ficus carica TaxID=3494 RepID=A0AA87ZFW4_FICCA|nr:hypothetical protein TIFTF001_003449 [Ficus carica]